MVTVKVGGSNKFCLSCMSMLGEWRRGTVASSRITNVDGTVAPWQWERSLSLHSQLLLLLCNHESQLSS